MCVGCMILSIAVYLHCSEQVTVLMAVQDIGSTRGILSIMRLTAQLAGASVCK